MERGRGNSRTMQQNEQKNSILKASRFAEHGMLSVRWHEFVQTMEYKIIELVGKSLNAIHIYMKEIFKNYSCYLFFLNGRRGLFRPGVSRDTLDLFFS